MLKNLSLWHGFTWNLEINNHFFFKKNKNIFFFLRLTTTKKQEQNVFSKKKMTSLKNVEALLPVIVAFLDVKTFVLFVTAVSRSLTQHIFSHPHHFFRTFPSCCVSSFLVLCPSHRVCHQWDKLYSVAESFQGQQCVEFTIRQDWIHKLTWSLNQYNILFMNVAWEPLLMKCRSLEAMTVVLDFSQIRMTATNDFTCSLAQRSPIFATILFKEYFSPIFDDSLCFRFLPPLEYFAIACKHGFLKYARTLYTKLGKTPQTDTLLMEAISQSNSADFVLWTLSLSLELPSPFSVLRSVIARPQKNTLEIVQALLNSNRMQLPTSINQKLDMLNLIFSSGSVITSTAIWLCKQWQQNNSALSSCPDTSQLDRLICYAFNFGVVDVLEWCMSQFGDKPIKKQSNFDLAYQNGHVVVLEWCLCKFPNTALFVDIPIFFNVPFVSIKWLLNQKEMTHSISSSPVFTQQLHMCCPKDITHAARLFVNRYFNSMHLALIVQDPLDLFVSLLSLPELFTKQHKPKLDEIRAIMTQHSICYPLFLFRVILHVCKVGSESELCLRWVVANFEDLLRVQLSMQDKEHLLSQVFTSRIPWCGQWLATLWNMMEGLHHSDFGIGVVSRNLGTLQSLTASGQDMDHAHRIHCFLTWYRTFVQRPGV